MKFEAEQCLADAKAKVPKEAPVPVLRRSGRVQKQTEFYQLWAEHYLCNNMALV